MEKQAVHFKLAWRLALARWETEAEFALLLNLFREYREIVDEVALFETGTHHLYLPLETVRHRAGLLKDRMHRLRELGIPSVGINVLTTIGHLNEAWDWLEPLPFQAMTGHDGSVSTGCACPNTPEFREYIRAKYRLMAEAEPAFIWVDDDIRMHNHGVVFGCFCDTCLRLFAARAGREFTREALVETFNQPEHGQLRHAWITQNVKIIESLLKDVAAAVHEVNPAIQTGLMTVGPGGTTYSGSAFPAWFKALKAEKARPGGGFYSDAGRLEIIGKILEVAHQRAALPKTVTDVQYELENFPYQTLRKSVASAIHENTLAIAAGLNGTAFNVLGMEGAGLEDYRPLLERVRQNRPFWNRLLTAVDGMPTDGLWPVWSPQLMARRRLRSGETWLGNDPRYAPTKPYILAEIGLPLAADRPASGVILSGRIAEAYSDAELHDLLTRAVLMDSETAHYLQGRGMESLIGVRVQRRHSNGLLERFTSDPLNEPYAGCGRDARIEFWGDATGMADALESAADKVRVLSTLESYSGEKVGDALTVFQNGIGGRVAVLGYAPWMFLHSPAKRQQLLNIADWITRNSLPLRIEEAVPLFPMVRMTPDRKRGAVILLNTGLEAVPMTTLRIRAPRPKHHLLELTETRETELGFEPEIIGWTCVLRNLPAWSITCVLWE